MDLLVIDLDGTITKSDNLIGFSYYMILTGKRLRFMLIFPLLILLKIKFISNNKFKIWYSYLILRNQNVNDIKNCAQDFISQESFQNNINKDVLKSINDQKDTTKIILSANYSFIAEMIAKLLKIETCLAINLETTNGKYSGLIIGQIPYGKEKIFVLTSFLNNKKYNKTIGFGDSKSDIPFLKYLDEGYLVTFNKKINKTSFIRV